MNRKNAYRALQRFADSGLINAEWDEDLRDFRLNVTDLGKSVLQHHEKTVEHRFPHGFRSRRSK